MLLSSSLLPALVRECLLTACVLMKLRSAPFYITSLYNVSSALHVNDACKNIADLDIDTISRYFLILLSIATLWTR